jgi:hypothetical protein
MTKQQKNTISKKQSNPIKRVISYHIAPGFMCAVVPGKTYFATKYILDHGNLIQDIQRQFSEIICVNDSQVQSKKIEFAQSAVQIRRDLEYQISATGASRFNAESTAKKLLEQYVR